MRERWPEVERIYSAVVARPESEWIAALAELCAGDDSLRNEVESLLAHEQAAGTFLETPAFAGADMAGHLASERALVGRRFGPYTVLAPIGSGGMGEVYRARDEKASGDPCHETGPLCDAKGVGDEHRPGDPFREGDLDGSVIALLTFSHERCALEQQCDRARQCGDADVTSIDVHQAPMATVGVDSGWGLGRHAIPALVPLGENARRKLQGWGDSHSAQPATAIETQ